MKVEIFSRPGCHLCEEAKTVIRRVRQVVPFEFTETDITSDPGFEKKFGEQIPVVFIDGKKAFKFFFTEEEFLKKIKTRRTNG